jgi:hypothetical protein
MTTVLNKLHYHHITFYNFFFICKLNIYDHNFLKVREFGTIRGVRKAAR